MCTRLEIFLVRPTKYDEEGYLLRHVRSVLPSNTLACLHALTTAVRDQRLLGDVEVGVHLCDESVEPVPERRIRRLARQASTRVLVCLVGVQTSQFPRAGDLAMRYRSMDLPVLIGGFHVSGSLAMCRSMPDELERLMALGVVLVAGEIEDVWPRLLADAVRGELAPLYDALDALPDLSRARVPHLTPHALRRFVYRHFATIDTSRGCPFKCSFCTIINVQGRRVRSRAPSDVVAAIAANARATGVTHYFFTDDNFARSAVWEEIFAGLVRLRDDRGLRVRFLMQVDLVAHRIPGFVEQARRAGCFQVFLGMESLDPATLRAAGKHQNRVSEYAELVRAWHEAEILTHVGYVIGFPQDTPASVRAGICALREEVRVDLASFFMLTPLPGSADHLRMAEQGAAMDADWNRYDTFHPVVDHPTMTRAEWTALYREAWSDFYSAAHMRSRLGRHTGEQRATLLQMYLWYRCATVVEGFHPMMTGFVRLKPRRDRRPSVPVDGLLRHWSRRRRELGGHLLGYGRVLSELQAIWSEVERVDPRAHPGGVGRATKLREWGAFLATLLGRSSYEDPIRQRRPKIETIRAPSLRS